MSMQSGDESRMQGGLPPPAAALLLSCLLMLHAWVTGLTPSICDDSKDITSQPLGGSEA